MKFNSLAILSLIATVSLGSIQEVTAYQTPTATPVATTGINQIAAAVGQSANFRRGEHATQGKVSIVKKNNTRYLQFDRNFRTSSGPDVYVILHRSSAPQIYGLRRKDYVLVGRLRKFSGSQSYAIPANLQLSGYKSVAVWCRKFNATFGYASIGG
ncbi:DM13 domain-containing protein [Nostoc sp. LEGE 06077]|uniref:DM13 domain-containing protein n=1 Tax=Nostoc sp. LEGE 06077 TaxID=915325 RepID=UPI0018828C7F|nr:DM13 domain-containing protein [Nostoc sp. LEGE 06077]MBE9208273.1 DM13 domain-containing protein [Nostoc sp. LEGE 06077]